MASDLQINIALAKALGWKEWGTSLPWGIMDNGFYHASVDGVVWCKYVDENSFIERKLDYRDPVVFVAICKRWGLTVEFAKTCSQCISYKNIYYSVSDSIEKAAVLCVIDLVKRGIK